MLTHASLFKHLSLHAGCTEETVASGVVPQSAVLCRKWETLLVCSIHLLHSQTSSYPSVSSSSFSDMSLCVQPPPLLLCGTSERKARHLYYSDLRERVLRSECRQQEEVYFQLAGYAMQADLGDLPLTREDTEAEPYFEPKKYFPPWVGKSRIQQNLRCAPIFSFGTSIYFMCYVLAFLCRL